jgi:hypothetical protein
MCNVAPKYHGFNDGLSGAASVVDRGVVWLILVAVSLRPGKRSRSTSRAARRRDGREEKTAAKEMTVIKEA